MTRLTVEQNPRRDAWNVDVHGYAAAELVEVKGGVWDVQFSDGTAMLCVTFERALECVAAWADSRDWEEGNPECPKCGFRHPRFHICDNRDLYDPPYAVEDDAYAGESMQEHFGGAGDRRGEV